MAFANASGGTLVIGVDDARTTGAPPGKSREERRTSSRSLIFLQPIVTSRLVEERPQITRVSAISAVRQLADLDRHLDGCARWARRQMRFRAEAILSELTD